MGNRTGRSRGRAASSGRTAASRGAGARRGATAKPRRPDQARRSPRAADEGQRGTSAGRRPQISWPRRIGLVGGLLLAGAGMVVAGQVLLGGGQGDPTASLPAGSISADPSGGPADATPIGGLPAAPVLDQPVAATAARSITVSGRLREALPAASGPYRLRVYVNEALGREVRIGRQEIEFRVADVPLVRGPNSIRAAVSGAFGETLHSAAVVVERDDVAPTITVTVPGDGAVAYAETMLVSGTTEPGAVVMFSNPAASAGGSVLAGAGGEFSLPVRLAVGSNDVALTSRDRAGNSAQVQLTIERRESAAGLTLALSRDTFELDRLPATITVTAHVTSVDGTPVDGVEVVFSISVPGQTTTTYSATTRAGVAGWPNVPLPGEGAIAGRGLVTALATLADGQELRSSASFTFR